MIDAIASNKRKSITEKMIPNGHYRLPTKKGTKVTYFTNFHNSNLPQNLIFDIYFLCLHILKMKLYIA